MKNFKKYFIIILVLITIISPFLSFAAISGDGVNTTPKTTLVCKLNANPMLGDLFNYVTCIISSSVIPLIFAIAVAMFIWGVAQYVINTEDEAKRAKGRQFMLWGIIALTVMTSIWGLVAILGNTFGIENVIPQVKTQ